MTIKTTARLSTAAYLALSLLSNAIAATDLRYVPATIDGERLLVRDDRQPALFTADYGDCLGGSSLINVTRFEAAYYKDNMTVAFHLGGYTDLAKEDIMMFLGVYAYGESRFELTFNPCNANIWSACPLQAGVPIEAAGFIPVSPMDVSGIPDLALTIPDFEGESVLRIFSNSTQTEIGCFAAQITNGNTFEHRAVVSSTLAAFTIFAALSSFATVAYYDSTISTRNHYAHSCSVLVVFAVWHHIFYSGALSVNWPTVLIAFWSNYAWAGGMISLERMQSVINWFVGTAKSSTSGTIASIESAYNIHEIYKRYASSKAFEIEDLVQRSVTGILASRLANTINIEASVDTGTAFRFYGRSIKPGVPLPGDHFGFAGTLAKQSIPAVNAFTTGLIWFLILVASVIFAVVSFKLLLEGLCHLKLIRHNCCAYFRGHLGGYVLISALRTLLIGFFTITFLAISQFSFLVSAGPAVLACIVLLGFLLGLGGIACWACISKYKHSYHISEPDRINLEKIKILKFLPWCRLSRQSDLPRSGDKVYIGSVPWWRISTFAEDKSVHHDSDFTKNFGWLVSRFRRTRWWFFTVWLLYEFIRACFLAGAAGQPMVQVFGLLAVEVVALLGLIKLRPFEGQRLNVVVVYSLGFSKVVTVALSATFMTRFDLPRIPATVVGIIIIVIHGFLTIAVLVAVIIGAITSYMSITRNQNTIRPKQWNHMRTRYLQHVESRSHDIPRPRHTRARSEHELQSGPYFYVNEVKRLPKVEDEDYVFMHEIKTDPYAPQLSLPESHLYDTIDLPLPRTASIQSQMSLSSLPRRARLHRASWSSQDFCTSTIRTPDFDSRPTSRILHRLNTGTDSCDDLQQQRFESD
ncbi:TRP-domain-containing protein [Macroventuria anomochaeta]|uniref:TRP-domain-containing protein n=1 Tax=Macroventuria anomochaeta TaxID=301207 RepID=A0ACB6S949_9PLEO|nr:TRP-domain-containing protein [Macroventuria anomochaeta]KAF2629662.1 TRP-domain-containing protein [Macroventuria anomochaeta]